MRVVDKTDAEGLARLGHKDFLGVEHLLRRIVRVLVI